MSHRDICISCGYLLGGGGISNFFSDIKLFNSSNPKKFQILENISFMSVGLLEFLLYSFVFHHNLNGFVIVVC